MATADEIKRIYQTQGTAAAAKAAQEAGGYLTAGGEYRPKVPILLRIHQPHQEVIK